MRQAVSQTGADVIIRHGDNRNFGPSGGRDSGWLIAIGVDGARGKRGNFRGERRQLRVEPRSSANGRNQREAVAGGRSCEGPLTEPIAFSNGSMGSGSLWADIGALGVCVLYVLTRHLMGSAGGRAARLKSQSAGRPHATESAPSSAPSLGVAPLGSSVGPPSAGCCLAMPV
jgi:hypothetical protein